MTARHQVWFADRGIARRRATLSATAGHAGPPRVRVVDAYSDRPLGRGTTVLSAGAVLNDRYRLEERVATGGMGQVWRATDRTLQRPVAVKVLLPALLSDEEFCARFQAEARMLAALHHPGVVRVYDYGESVSDTGERAMYLVMQYVEGEPLSRRIKDTGRLTVSETMALVAKTAQALHAAHLGGIIHRDVKPDNLLVQADGSVVLVDFGVARSSATTRLTAANTVLG